MTDLQQLRELVREIPDFPSPGIAFKDITPLLADARAFATVVDLVAERFTGRGVTRVLGIEARGFIIAAPVAYRLGAGFVPARKHGKLPSQVNAVDYTLEYGAERLEIHSDAVTPADHVLVVDDVLATGGTACAAVELVEGLGATIVGIGVVIELAFLGGRERLETTELFSILSF